jgi:hypothetical protein
MSTALLDTTSTPEPLPDLAPVGYVLRNLEARQQLLSEMTSEEAQLANKIFQLATRLEAATGWDGDLLARCLGCPAETIKDFRELGEESLAVSGDYMALLWELEAFVETPFDKRTLLLGYGHLYRGANNEVARLRDAFFDEGPERPVTLLELGEVQGALDRALLAIHPDAFRRPRNPYGGSPEVHISTSRLDALINGELEVLGPAVVVPRMWEHIHGQGAREGCDACREALEYRQEHLQSAPRDIHTPVS